MIERCTDPSDKSYSNYGGRGVRIHEAWLEFDNFLTDVGACPEGLTLDRIDTNGDYAPGNVRWVDRKTQGRNKRNNRIVTVRGKTGSLSEVAEHFDRDYATIRNRIRKGWNLDRAFFAPLRKW